MKPLSIALTIACAKMIACAKTEAPPQPVPQKPIDAAPIAVDAAPVRPPVTPDTITSASKAWKPGPPISVGGKVDGDALRKKHRERLAADLSPVTILKDGTPTELGTKACETMIPARPPTTPVLIKPNLAGFNWFHDPKTHHGDDGVKGRITDPEFVRGVVRCLKAKGFTQITIADGFTGKPEDWNRLARISGYQAMTKEEGVTLASFDDDGVWDRAPGEPGKPLAIGGIDKTHVPTLLMPKLLSEYLDHGLYISIPKLKTHRFSVFSVGIKAMQGTVMYSDAAPAFRQKWRSHRELDAALGAIKKKEPDGRDKYVRALEIFAERMVDVLELEAPDVVIAEGTPAMDGDGFDGLYPRSENVAIGGTNVVMVDRVAAEYLGLWDNDALAKELGGHRTSPLLEVAAKRFGIDIAQPKLAGDGAAILATRQPAHLHGMAGFEIETAVDKGEPAVDETVPDGATKELHATKVAEAPKLDGEIDAAWANATPLAFATDWAGKSTPTTTTVRALWNDKGLYLLWELENTELITDRSRPIDQERVDLYEEDCIELFLSPGERRRYFEIEVGPYGHWFDISVDRTGKKAKSDTAWTSGAIIGTSRDAAKHRAVIEMAFATPAIQANARLPIGLYRMNGKSPRQYLAAFPTRTPKPNFHVPDAFGTLVVDP